MNLRCMSFVVFLELALLNGYGTSQLNSLTPTVAPATSIPAISSPAPNADTPPPTVVTHAPATTTAPTNPPASTTIPVTEKPKIQPPIPTAKPLKHSPSPAGSTQRVTSTPFPGASTDRPSNQDKKPSEDRKSKQAPNGDSSNSTSSSPSKTPLIAGIIGGCIVVGGIAMCAAFFYAGRKHKDEDATDLSKNLNYPAVAENPAFPPSPDSSNGSFGGHSVFASGFSADEFPRPSTQPNAFSHSSPERFTNTIKNSTKETMSERFTNISQSSRLSYVSHDESNSYSNSIISEFRGTEDSIRDTKPGDGVSSWMTAMQQRDPSKPGPSVYIQPRSISSVSRGSYEI